MRSFLLVLTLIVAHSAHAAELGRYVSLSPGSTHAQRHPLQVTLEAAHFPQDIATIGEAISHLLARSGYRLDVHQSRHAQAILLPQPLPEVHRNLGPIYLSEALAVLTGDAWRIRVNPLYRTVIIYPQPAWQAHLERQLPQITFEAAHTDDPLAPVTALRTGSPGPALTPRPRVSAPPPEMPRAQTSVDAHTAPQAEPEAVTRTPAQNAATSEPAPKPVPPAQPATPGNLQDHTEIFINEMSLEETLDMLVPSGWRLQPEVQPALLQARISMVSSSTWWDALTELARTLGAQTRTELQLHVFENQRLVVLEQL